MFVARENEISRIKQFLSKRGALLIYGLRRVGKTTLIKKVLEESNRDYIYFECQKADEKINVSLFVDLLKEKMAFVDAQFDSFLTVFKEINKSYTNLTIVIDEYSYIKQYYLESKKTETKQLAERLDSEFQNIIDDYLDNNSLILSGSSIHIMESLTEHSSPLYGRFIDKIVLKQFSYLDAKKMLPSLSNKDFVAFYSVFGGSPYVLERVNETKSLDENICDLILDESGTLRTHLNNNVINELESDPDLHNILSVIKNGCKKYNEIESQCHIETSGLLDKRLKKLLELDIVETKFMIGKENDKKKKYYQIKDNLLRFYYAYVFRQDNRINLLGEQRFFGAYILPSLKEYISRRFEIIVRDYFSIAIKKGMYPCVIDIGSYFASNSEFDCVLKKDDDSYAIYEVKYYSNKMKESEMRQEIAQIKSIKGLNVTEIGFVSSSGFQSRIEGIKYIELDELFF